MIRDSAGLETSLKCLLNCTPGGLLFGVGDMAIHAEVTPEVIVGESRDLILGPDTRDDGDGNLIMGHT